MIPRLLILPAALLAAALLPSAKSAPEGMVKIPAGTFDYGTDSAELPALVERYHLPSRDIVASETPRYRVKIAAFWMDRTEVTVADYIRFIVDDTTWMPKGDSGRISNGDYLETWRGGIVNAATDSMPVTYVTWFAARAFCKRAGKRLPTEAEWEYAAHGGVEGDVFPWGDAPPDPARANYAASGIEHPMMVAHYPANGYGLFDMAGNVWEFTADQWSDPRALPTSKALELEPWRSDRTQAARQRVVIRGGSYAGAPVNLRVRYRDSHPAGEAQPYVGFRCAKNS
jgi:formylglycine-generating enzyme required for sulfatase activity